MLHSTFSPLTPRPKPPRTRSGQQTQGGQSAVRTANRLADLAKSDQDQDQDHPTFSSPTPRTAQQHDAIQAISHSRLSSVDSAVSHVTPDTPPYTPPLPAANLTVEGGNNSHVQGGSSRLDQSQQQHINNPEELQRMLEDAHRTIKERERDLSLAASIGKSLLDNNIALRARQDALLHRVTTSPKKTKLPASDNAGIAADAHAGPNQFYGAKGVFIESQPPPSPRPSRIVREEKTTKHEHDGEAASPDPDSAAWTDDEETLQSNSSWSPKQQTLARNRQSATTSPMSKRRSDGVHNAAGRRSRQSSISSLFPTSHSNSSLVSDAGIENSVFNPASLATPNQLQQQHAQLANQNAELEKQLEELESELSRADANGKRKLRRLDKELEALKHELESALTRNEELEEKLEKKTSTSSGRPSVPPRREVDEPVATQDHAHPTVRNDQDDAWLESLMLHQHSQPSTNSCGLTELPPHSVEAMPTAAGGTGRIRLGRRRPSEARPESALVAQLLGKISELQETNDSIATHEQELNERLEKAQRDFQEMKRKYDFLEERLLDAEMHDHQVLGWHRKGLIDWKPETDEEVQSQSPTASSKRKARGNRPMIERHRRLSSLLGDQIMPHIPRSGSMPLSDIGSTPEKGRDSLWPSPSHSNSHATSPTRGPLSSTFGRSRSRSSTFHGDSYDEANQLVYESPVIDAHSGGMTSLSDSGPDPPTNFTTYTTGHWGTRLASYNTSVTASPSLDDINDSLGGPFGDLRLGPRGTHNLANEFSRSCGTSTSNETDRTVSSSDAGASSNGTARQQESLFSHSIHLPSALAIVRSRPVTAGDSPEDNLSSLLPEGAPNAESYEALERALADLPVEWDDDDPARVQRTLLRDIEAANEGAPKGPRTQQGSLTWVYHDSESEENDENDPWKEEGRGHLALESREQVDARETAEQRVARRRRRLQELAEELHRADEQGNTMEDDARLFKRRLEALRSLGSERDLVRTGATKGSQGADEEGGEDEEADAESDFEHLDTKRKLGSRGTDYWPVSFRARYHPTVVAMRVKTTSQTYIKMIVLWTRFLTVLAVAVAFSLWKGPKEGLGLRRLPQGGQGGALARRKKE